jgi:hypothetical protein
MKVIVDRHQTFDKIEVMKSSKGKQTIPKASRPLESDHRKEVSTVKSKMGNVNT